MGIDITKFKRFTDEEFLEALGDGDWQITLPNNYPDLLVTKSWREALEKEVGSDFVRWVIKGIDIQINHDHDPPWDSSGHARSYEADSLMLLIRYAHLEDWLENAYTGQSRASYVSGMGIFWETYKEKTRERIDELSFVLLKAHVKPLQSHIEEYDEDAWDEGYDEVDLVDICLQGILEEWLKRLSTKQLWHKYERMVREELAEEAVIAEQARQAHKELKEFWESAFGDIGQEKIELPEYRSRALEQRFQDAFADTAPDLLEAIIRFGAPLHCSNSVDLAIRHLAKDALK